MSKLIFSNIESNFVRKPVTIFNRALTSSYVDSDSVEIDIGVREIVLLFTVVKGSLNSIEFITYQSIDGLVWYRLPTLNVGSVILIMPNYYQISLTTDINFAISQSISFGNFFKVSVKGSGTTTGNNCKIDIIGYRV